MPSPASLFAADKPASVTAKPRTFQRRGALGLDSFDVGKRARDIARFCASGHAGRMSRNRFVPAIRCNSDWISLIFAIRARAGAESPANCGPVCDLQ